MSGRGQTAQRSHTGAWGARSAHPGKLAKRLFFDPPRFAGWAVGTGDQREVSFLMIIWRLEAQYLPEGDSQCSDYPLKRLVQV